MTGRSIFVRASAFVAGAIFLFFSTSGASAQPRLGGATPKEKVLYSFQGGADGAQPLGSLIADAAGNLYGTTNDISGYPCTGSPCGSIFELSPPSKRQDAPWVYSLLYSFPGGKDGGLSHGNLIFGPNGSLYGTTVLGGRYENRSTGGVVFRLNPPKSPGAPWTETVLHSFGRAGDGSNPQGGLAVDTNGNLYGTTPFGGLYGGGIAYEISPPTKPGGAWTETDLHDFGLNSDGFFSLAGVVVDNAGDVYGTTEYGGFYNRYCQGGCGEVFEVSPPAIPGDSWTYTVVHEFIPSPGGDGANPTDPLIFDKSGNLYGTTLEDPTGGGNAFKLSPPTARHQAWKETILYQFPDYLYDAQYSAAGLIFDAAGNLYGTSSNGGAYYDGTVFELMPPAVKGAAWTDALLHTFNRKLGGSTYPGVGLIFGKGGALFGTTQYGGTGNCRFGRINGCGTVFMVTP